MDVYTLTSSFVKDTVIDEFESIIWTERYISEGEVSLTVPFSPEMSVKLSEGTFLSIEESKEVMIIDTKEISDDLIKVNGTSLLGFLRNRFIRIFYGRDLRYWYLTDLRPGELLATIVQEMCIDGDHIDPDYLGAKIPNLTLGDVDITWGGVNVALPFGSVYDALHTIAETYRIGMSLYLDSADESDYSLKFTSYNGRNLTSSQDVYPMVRFSPALDSLTNVKELRSISGYHNVVYVIAPLVSDVLDSSLIAVAYATPESPLSFGFDRRMLLGFVDDISLTDDGMDEITFRALVTQRAKDILANNNYTKVVDGEVVPQSEFKYGTHYKLGDIIELQGYTDLIQKARITEYIRSKDDAGERSYPTITIVEDSEIDGWFGGTD